MLVGAVLALALDTKLAFYLWMEVQALGSIRTSREVLAVFGWMHERAVLSAVVAVRKMLAPYLFVLIRNLLDLNLLALESCFFLVQLRAASVAKPHHTVSPLLLRRQ